MTAYDAAVAQWRENPRAWWLKAARGLDWARVPEEALDADGRWFADGRLNICHNALDRHVAAGHGARTALIHDSPVTGVVQHISYAQMLDRTSRLAGALAARGVGLGDRVIIYMPMVPEAAIAMLACARLGAIHSVVFGGFAAAELAVRIDDATPRVIISASCGIEGARTIAYKPLLDAAIGMAAHKPDFCLVLQRPALPCALTPGQDFDYVEEEAAGTPHPCVDVPATAPLYILYTSGTTGKPKGIVRDQGGYAVVLHQSMSMIYGMRAGEVFWTASDVGWVVGHSYIVYAPLLAGCTSVLFEGKPVGTPDAGTFWRVCAQHGVKLLFTAPTAIRAIRKEDPEGALMRQHDLSKLEALYLAGERCDPPTAHWITGQLNVPVVDHWWQTETGWPITAGFRGLGLFAPRPGAGGKPSPGYDVRALDAKGHEVPRGQQGALVIKLPLPPGCAPTLWNAAQRYHEAYLSTFPGYYDTSDAGMVDSEGFVWVMGRTDDIINVAGHRLSTGAMEEVLAAHPDVAECAVVGVADALKGQAPLGLVVLKAGAARDAADVARELVALVRERIGPVAAFRQARVVPRLPKTRSGKILRGTIRKIADGEAYAVPATIDDPLILEEIAKVLGR